MKIEKSKIILLSLLTILSCTIYALIIRMGMGPETILFFKNALLKSSTIQGVLQTLIFFICIVMVMVDYKAGCIISKIILIITMLSNLSRILKMKDFSTLPGVGTAIISLMAIDIISHHLIRKEKIAFTDFLTGLPNRRQFVKDIRNKITERTQFSLVYIELVNYRNINDTYGLSNGDIAIKVLSERLKSEITAFGEIYHITGSEFALLFDGNHNPVKRVEYVMNVSSDKVHFNDDASCDICLCSGISRFANDKESYVELLKEADVALSYARNSLTRKIFVFDEEMEIKINEKVETENLIKKCLANDGFYLEYQPQYEVNTKKLRGFEALLRMKGDIEHRMNPDYFIPFAEKSDLILKIDDYVLKHVLQEFKPVIQKNPDLTISVNVSAKNIGSLVFCPKTKGVIMETGFNPSNLEIEITEYSIDESKTTISNIRELKELGVKIALDDFGTGYTSIAQLIKLPFDLLKIDKSLIENIESNEINRSLLDTVIYMGHLINAEVISEGVETKEQLELLKSHNCEFVQGFYWGKPVKIEEAMKIVEEDLKESFI